MNNLSMQNDRTMTEGCSLKVFHNNEAVYENSGKWLHPLFELEDFLSDSDLNPAEMKLHDKIAGKAAATLISKMGFRQCHIDLISRLGLVVFEEAGVSCTYNELVERILCKTEDLIDSEMSQNEIYAMLRQRSGRS